MREFIKYISAVMKLVSVAHIGMSSYGEWAFFSEHLFFVWIVAFGPLVYVSPMHCYLQGL